MELMIAIVLLSGIAFQEETFKKASLCSWVEGQGEAQVEGR
jgi:hypothetical protein